MAHVHLLGEQRRLCSGLKTIDIEASTVGALIAELERRFPAIRESRLGAMSVAIDGEVMTNADYERIGPDSDVHFLAPIGGG